MERHSERYANSSQASAFLIPGRQGYSGDYLRHVTNHWNTFGALDRLSTEGLLRAPRPEKLTEERARRFRLYPGGHLGPVVEGGIL